MKRTRHVIEIGKGRSLDEIKDAIEDDSDLISLLVGDLNVHDMRATFCDGSFAVDEIYKVKGRGLYTIEFSYEWDAYYGCQDMCGGDTEQDSATFRYWGERLIFEIEEPTVNDRITVEEF